MITISEEIIRQSQMSERELKQMIAVLLFERKILPFVQARKFANMQRVEFMDLLGKNEVALNDSIESLQHDLEVIEKLDHARNK
jgi:predicted HTH domain antitoxin